MCLISENRMFLSVKPKKILGLDEMWRAMTKRLQKSQVYEGLQWVFI